MPRRALLDHRPWLLAALAFGISYFFARDAAIGGLWLIAWKGAGVGCLAVYAARRALSADGWLIAAVLAFGALGDMALELSLLGGAALFAVGHALAIWLYLRHPRRRPSGSQRAAGLALALLTPLVAGLIAYPQPLWPAAAVYSLFVGAMAGAAWTSRFPRYRVGLGAVAFVASDLIIFAREAGLAGDTLASWTIWPLYFGGQVLIATGVVETLRRERS